MPTASADAVLRVRRSWSALRRVLRVPGLALLFGPVAAVAATDTRVVEDDGFAAQRARMVERQVVARGVRDARVLEAMRTVPRHRFVPDALADHAYDDRPLPIGHEQTISQPYIVAHMTELARVAPGDRVLEIGTGSGYQAAVLSRLAETVHTIEIVAPLARQASQRLQALGYDNIVVREGDGYAGWPERAPFDAIVVTAAPEQVPQALLEQLAPGGRMVIPVGPVYAVQQLRLIEKLPSGELRDRRIAPVRFVPMTGGD